MNRTIKDWEMRITWKKSEESKKWKHASTWDEGNGGENADLFASEH
jgi:two-component sensor histidine kinase